MNLGGAEIIVILVVALLVLGPDKLPTALRTFGRVMGEVRKYQDLAKNEIEKAMTMPVESKEMTTTSTVDTSNDESIEGNEKISEKSLTQETHTSIAPIVDDDDE